jgi:hypothetical protein
MLVKCLCHDVWEVEVILADLEETLETLVVNQYVPLYR